MHLGYTRKNPPPIKKAGKKMIDTAGQEIISPGIAAEIAVHTGPILENRPRNRRSDARLGGK